MDKQPTPWKSCPRKIFSLIGVSRGVGVISKVGLPFLRQTFTGGSPLHGQGKKALTQAGHHQTAYHWRLRALFIA